MLNASEFLINLIMLIVKCMPFMAIHGQSHSGYLWIFLKLAGVHPIDLSKVQIIQSFGT
jgi:hypothetical protein